MSLAARTGVLRGIGSMGAAVTNMVLRSHQDGTTQVDKVSMVEVVKQATSITSKKKDSAEEDVLVMDTKLKIIEILQVCRP